MKNYDCSIIANPEGAFWDFTQKVYSYLKKREGEDLSDRRKTFAEGLDKKLNEEFPNESNENRKRFAMVLYDCLCNGNQSRFRLNPVTIKSFPDKEFKPKIKENVRRSNCFFIHDSNLEPSRWYTEMKFINGALRNSSAHEIINILPYHLFARQDTKDESRTSINSQDVAEVLDHDHTRVITIDVHSAQIQGGYRKATFDTLPSFPTVIKYLTKNHPELDFGNMVVLGPDEGSIKRVRKYAKGLGINIAIVDKFRQVSGELGQSLGILGDVRGKDVLEIDDIISSGNTALSGEKAARNNGAKSVWMYVTHGLFTEGYEEFAANFDRVLVGDTIRQRPEFFKYPNFGIVSFADLIGETIYRIDKGDSLSELFK